MDGRTNDGRWTPVGRAKVYKCDICVTIYARKRDIEKKNISWLALKTDLRVMLLSMMCPKLHVRTQAGDKCLTNAL